MDKRYQVFVSSTFADLQEERQEVMQALLELDCMPAGMELFPAANDDQWSLIRKVIDDCDYYIVIVAGRYGSLGPDGRSYTEMEYRYAVERGKPVIGFLHRDPGSIPASRTESSADGKEKLNAFRALVQQKMCRHWETAADLGSQVSRSVVKLIKSSPAIGWVRADLVPDEVSSVEILRLRKQVEELEMQLASTRMEAPPGSEALAHGSDSYELQYSFTARAAGQMWGGTQFRATMSLTWDDIFGLLSPRMMQEATEADLKEALDEYVAQTQVEQLGQRKDLRGRDLVLFSVTPDDFHTIKVQLRALGLMTKSAKPRSVKDTGTYWTLTPYGDTMMTRLRAIRRFGEGQSL